MKIVQELNGSTSPTFQTSGLLASAALIKHSRPSLLPLTPGPALLVPQSTQRIHSEPRWRPVPRFTSAQLPHHCRNWLLDDGSLTGRLIESSSGLFSVRRRFQGWQVPLSSERELLKMPNRQQALIREVELQLDGRAVVFARSVFPYSSLTGRFAHLRRLGNKPLGAILFQNPGMHRSPFELAHLAGDTQYLPQDLQQEQPAWARRSCFEIQNSTLMVSEVFLENFTPWQAILPVHRTQRGKVSAAIMRGKQ